MTKDEIQLLYEYDRWASNRVLHAASTLSYEKFTRDLSGSFRSLRDTLAERLQAEVESSKYAAAWLAFVGAWTHKSGSNLL